MPGVFNMQSAASPPSEDGSVHSAQKREDQLKLVVDWEGHDGNPCLPYQILLLTS